MKKRNFITHLHLKSKRNYKKRMFQNKVYCMKIAKKYGEQYWDGNRRFGYGGYKFIDGYWKQTALKLIKTYRLNNDSKILDTGCGKGFLLHELKKILPGISIAGLDISNYAIKNSKIEIKKNLRVFDCRKKLPYRGKFFDLVISLGTIHNFNLIEIESIVKEIVRVGKKAYIMVESYRNNKELFNLQCWALTCETFFSPIEWKHVFKSNKYNGDYEFIYFN